MAFGAGSQIGEYSSAWILVLTPTQPGTEHHADHEGLSHGAGPAHVMCLPPSRDCDFLTECVSVVNETRAVTPKKTSEISVALGSQSET